MITIKAVGDNIGTRSSRKEYGELTKANSLTKASARCRMNMPSFGEERQVLSG